MMDSQENAPVISPSEETGNNEVMKEEVAAQPAETLVAQTASPVETEEVQPQKVYETKAEILERVREIAHTDESPQKEEIDYLKTVFYKLHIAEREAKIKAFIDAGGDPEQYQISPDEQEEAFKAEMGIIKEKRAKIFKEQEAEKQENLTKKLAIIDKIKAMITTPEEANKSYQEFKREFLYNPQNLSKLSLYSDHIRINKEIMHDYHHMGFDDFWNKYVYVEGEDTLSSINETTLAYCLDKHDFYSIFNYCKMAKFRVVKSEYPYEYSRIIEKQQERLNKFLKESSK